MGEPTSYGKYLKFIFFFVEPLESPVSLVSQNFSLYDALDSFDSIEMIIHTQIGLWSRRYSQKDIFGLGWISSEVCKIPEVETHNAWINRLAERRLHKKTE